MLHFIVILRLQTNGQGDSVIGPGIVDPRLERVPSRCRFVCITEFYNSLENSLHWVRGPRPTSQTRAVIQLLKREVTKGLGPKDWDGFCWNESPALNRKRALLERA
jgi:hypothetical protein